MDDVYFKDEKLVSNIVFFVKGINVLVVVSSFVYYVWMKFNFMNRV